MVRKLVLLVMILALAAVPVPALARDGGHHGRQDFRGHRRVEHFHGRPFIGLYAFPSYAYVQPRCYWQAGYWVNQPYVDAWGRYAYVPQWVPAQWICP
jgi:hypothetical protein